MFILTKVVLSIDRSHVTQLNAKPVYDAPLSLCLIVITLNKIYDTSNLRNCQDNKSSDESIKKAASNSLFQIKKLRIKNANKIIIGNININ